MRMMVLLAFVLIAGCSTIKEGYSVENARNDLLAIQETRKALLRLELAYVKQPPCGLAGSPAPPLCASYKVAKTMEEAHKAVSAAIGAAEAAITNLGDDSGNLRLAVETARAAVTAWQGIIQQRRG